MENSAGFWRRPWMPWICAARLFVSIHGGRALQQHAVAESERALFIFANIPDDHALNDAGVRFAAAHLRRQEGRLSAGERSR